VRQLLEGRNVNLRVMEKEDIPLLTEWFNSPEVSGDFDFPPQSSRADIEKRFEKTSSEPDLFKMRTFIIEKKDGTKIGYIVHFNMLHPAGNMKEIGYVLVPSERGKGYCTEAVRILVDYLFLTKDIPCIQAIADVRNRASQRVLEKSGFQKEGITRKRLFFRGEWTNNSVYSILREEWKEPKILTRTEKE
jgi:RimJ/RimL family protein N-acetyltransferase